MDETRDSGLLSTSAVLAGVDRELVVATGADRVRFLHGVVTGDVAGTPVGGGCHAALLTVKAHVVAEMRIFVREAELYLAVPAGQGAATAQALSRYAIMDDFAATPSAELGLLALLGPGSSDRLAAAGYSPVALASRPLWSHAEVAGPPGPLWLARARQLGVEGTWIGGGLVVLERLTEALQRLGVQRLSPEVAEAARVAAGEPAWGREITDDYFPTEIGLDDAIDYTKGCFLGQEPIVRIRDRGHLNWRLVRLELGAGEQAAAGSAEPAPGDQLETDLRPKAGHLTSVARLPDGRGVALGLVHASITSGQRVRIRAAAGVITYGATVIG